MSKPVSPDAFTYATQKTLMKLEYFINNNTETVEVSTESVMLEYFEKMREDDFLILRDAFNEFVQVLCEGQDSYFLEYHANGILFDADPESVPRTTAENAFVSYLRYGPNSVEFQCISAWVNTETKTKPDITHETPTENLMSWNFAASENRPDPDFEEIQAQTKFARQCISECKKQKTTTLNLGDCNLTAIPAKVMHLVWLKSLYMGNNYDLGKEVSDLAPLTSLVNLRTLNISNTQVSDLTPLVGLVSLQTLNISNTQVSDLTPLAGLVNLRTLNISGTQVRDLASLAGLVGLRTIVISNMPISDFAPLAGLLSLESLDVNLTQMRDLTLLAGLVGLRKLVISGTPVSDLTPLAGLFSLQTLDISGTQVRDFTPLAGLMNLCEVTPSLGVDEIHRHEFRALEVMAEMARAGKGKKLGQIAKERFQKTADIRYQLSHALRLLSQHDPYPRDAPLWQYVERMQWPARISPNAELVLHKVDLVYKVLTASARWKATAQEEKLQLQMGEDLPLPDYLLNRLKAMSLTLVRDLIATTRTVLKAGDLDQEDFELLKRYIDWYGLHFQDLHADVKISNNLSILSVSVSDLNLTVRAVNGLKAEGVETLGDLVRQSENYLLKNPNLGRKSLNEIRETLVALGLKLAGN